MFHSLQNVTYHEDIISQTKDNVVRDWADYKKWDRQNKYLRDAKSREKYIWPQALFYLFTPVRFIDFHGH